MHCDDDDDGNDEGESKGALKKTVRQWQKIIIASQWEITGHDIKLFIQIALNSKMWVFFIGLDDIRNQLKVS